MTSLKGATVIALTAALSNWCSTASEEQAATLLEILQDPENMNAVLTDWSRRNGRNIDANSDTAAVASRALVQTSQSNITSPQPFNSNSSNADTSSLLSPLFWLPVELFEEISQRFSRQEAALVLTVNSVFHEVFARRIWRNITQLDQKVWRAPRSAWKRYGHLVRELYLAHNCSLVNLAELPGIIRLGVEPTNESCNIFDQQMPLLQSLEIKKIRHNSADGEAMMKVVDWVISAEKRDREIDVRCYVDEFYEKQWRWMEELLVLIEKPERYSFLLGNRSYTFPFAFSSKLMHKLASMLLTLKFWGLDKYSVEDYFTSFVADNSIVFDKLHEMAIALPSRNRRNTTAVPSLLSSRFPVLKSLSLRWFDTFGSNFTHPFFNGSLKTVSSLNLFECNNECWNNIIGSVPNVQDISFHTCVLRFDVLVAAKQIPLLQKLSICFGGRVDFTHDGKCRKSADAITAGQLTKFKTLQIWADEQNSRIVSMQLYDFMVNHAPNLHTVIICNKKLTVPLSDEMNGAVNPSVKQLFFGGDSITESDFELILRRFPGLVKFSIDCLKLDKKLLTRVRAQYPNLNLIVKCRSMYWDPEGSDDSSDDSDYSDYSEDYDEDYDDDDDDGDDEY